MTSTPPPKDDPVRADTPSSTPPAIDPAIVQEPGYGPSWWEPSTTAQRRLRGRVAIQHVHCSIGEVLDLSATGMRVRGRCRAEPGQTVAIRIQGIDGPIDLDGEVVWSKRAGFWSRELGVRFLGVNEQTHRALTLLGRSAAHNETIRHDIDRARRKAG